uniref:Uncharacterized protein n=1 Tax=Knipowitschia caucasica TaxID=637954 RepID=A0AAV2JG10_KNICA
MVHSASVCPPSKHPAPAPAKSSNSINSINSINTINTINTINSINSINTINTINSHFPIKSNTNKVTPVSLFMGIVTRTQQT